MIKTFVCALLVTAAATIASAQTQKAADSAYTTTVRSGWNTIKRNITASAQAMPDANYSFKPTPEVRTFGELIGHLANEHYMLCSPLKGEKNPHQDTDYEKTTAKAELVKAITDSIAYCDAAYTSIHDDPKTTTAITANRRDTPFSLMVLNLTHDSEHYGNIVTYLRLKGIVPPSSQPSR
jgi:uncharacterized damage-inducible protein DinB